MIWIRRLGPNTRRKDPPASVNSTDFVSLSREGDADQGQGREGWVVARSFDMSTTSTRDQEDAFGTWLGTLELFRSYPCETSLWTTRH